MGTYTELCIGVRLYADTPQDVVDLLCAMLGDSKDFPAALPDHPLFRSERWRFMLYGGSASFPGTAHSLVREYAGERWELAVRSSFKNYGDEARLFCEWIAPYVDEDGIVGMIRSEQNDDFAQIIVMARRQLRLVPVDVSNETSVMWTPDERR